MLRRAYSASALGWVRLPFGRRAYSAPSVHLSRCADHSAGMRTVLSGRSWAGVLAGVHIQCCGRVRFPFGRRAYSAECTRSGALTIWQSGRTSAQGQREKDAGHCTTDPSGEDIRTFAAVLRHTPDENSRQGCASKERMMEAYDWIRFLRELRRSVHIAASMVFCS